MTAADVDRDFARAMVEVYRRAKDEAGYNATYYLQMLSTHGPVETARRLMAAPAASQGFTALWERHRLDLTVEAQVVKEEFASLFTDDERSAARHRLSEYGYVTRTAPS